MHKKTIAWDDLQYVLYVARTESIGAAARELGVNRTTVLRRINRFEETLDYTLFERRDTGYKLSPEAERLLEAAMEVEEKIDGLHRQIIGKTLQLQGNLKVTTTDSILHMSLIPHLATFRMKHPQIHVSVIASNHQLSLAQREADVAVRAGPLPSENLVNKKLALIDFGIYGSKDYLKGNNSKELREHRWLGFEKPISTALPGKWIEAFVPDCVCFRSDSFVTLKAAVLANMGLSILPVKLASQSSELCRVFSPEPNISLNIWLTAHPDVARSARVTAFSNHMLDVYGTNES